MSDEGAVRRTGLPRGDASGVQPATTPPAKSATRRVGLAGPGSRSNTSPVDPAVGQERTQTQRRAGLHSTATSDSEQRASTSRPSSTGSVDTGTSAMYRGYTLRQWIGLGTLGSLLIVLLFGALVLGVRALLTTPALQDFLTRFPGETPLPPGAPVGFPAWLGWQHFFNAFFMVLIITSGLRVRREKRPAAFWTPRRGWNGKKISLYLWFHQSLDILWMVNGALFVVLLFTTGQWMRIVPTSWEVLPNALSAGLQYISLDWPTENGWVNYNSLQVLAYFATVFIAAPLAAVSGYRMSEMWPKHAKGLSAFYPVEVARRIHFPVMLYFVGFIVVHVVLVMSTGALRNLNHMYAMDGSVDGLAPTNWVGFFLFAGSLVLMVGAVVASRPLLLAPVARLFGTVTR